MNRQVFASALSNRNVRATLLGFSAFTLVLHGSWLALVVFAFQQGGAAEVGNVALIVLVPAAILSPAVAVLCDRFVPRVALMLGFGLQALTLFLVAGAMAAGLSKYVVYALLACFTVTQMSSRPTVSSILPRVVVDPIELAAANSVTGFVETVGMVAGPALAGLLLFLADDPAVSFVACGGAMALAALAGLQVDTAQFDVDEDRSARESVRSQVAGGLHLLRTEAAPRQLVIVMTAMRFTVGVLDVGMVIIAVDHLRRSEASAGLLGMAIGVGAIVGAALTFLLVGRRWLSTPIAIGVACAALPIAGISLSSNFWVAVVLLAISGMGRPVVDVAVRTLLQGLSNDDMLARLFGFLEGLGLLVLAIGSALFSWLAVAFSLETALIVGGLIPLVITAALLTRLRRIDSGRPEIDPELLALVRSTPLFAHLAAFRLEQMLLNLDRQVWLPGQAIFEKGDYGEVLYVVDRGWVHVGLDEELGLRRGGFFGEIAVLRNQPRMASVRAGSEGAVTYRIHGEVFRDALATAPSSQRRSDGIVQGRLGEGRLGDGRLDEV